MTIPSSDMEMQNSFVSRPAWIGCIPGLQPLAEVDDEAAIANQLGRVLRLVLVHPQLVASAAPSRPANLARCASRSRP